MMEDSDPNVIKQLLTELRDINKETRRTAVMKLGVLGGDRATRVLMSTVQNEHEDLIVRARCALMLGKIGDSRAVDPLIRALAAPGFQTPMYAAQALGRIGDQRAIDPLIDLMNNSRDKIQKAAVNALHKLGYDENAEPAPKAPEPELT